MPRLTIRYLKMLYHLARTGIKRKPKPITRPMNKEEIDKVNEQLASIGLEGI